MNYTFKKADKDLFAIYETIYSKADLEIQKEKNNYEKSNYN